MKNVKIIKINPKNPDVKKIQEVCNIIKSGGIIIFPTDTVFGLGGDALNKKVIKSVFKIKKRQINKALSINIAYKKDLKKYVEKIPVPAKNLIKRFWPGQLTIIFKKSKVIPKELTGGSPYIGVRIPDNKIVFQILKNINRPIISTSANLSGKKNPVTIKEVKKLIGLGILKNIDAIIDDGNQCIGQKKESTIVDLSKGNISILRIGSIPIKDILKN